MDDDHQILYMPPGLSTKNIKGGGTSGLVAFIPASTVIKFSLGAEDENVRCSIECEVYERFDDSKYAGPESILKYFGKTDRGIILEYAENGTVRQFLRNANIPIQSGDVLRWAQQAATALMFSHKNGVLHGDLNCSNLLLDRHLDLKLADFAGSSVDGKPAMISYSSSHTLPAPHSLSSQAEGIQIGVDAEIFAFGSTLYEMVTGSEPYAGLPEHETEQLYRSKKFPSTLSLDILGDVISNCWCLKYNSMLDVLNDIEQEGRRSYRHIVITAFTAFFLFAHVVRRFPKVRLGSFL